MIKPFKGEGDVVAWLKKIELVAKLTKVGDLASFIPLYLEDGALAVYLEMEEDGQKNAETIKEKLLEAFSDSMFVAYSKLVKMRWTGESVDVFANELRRLSGLAGFKGDACERMVKLAFVHGFPDNIGIELQQVEGVAKVSMSDLLSRARILATNQSSSAIAAVAVRQQYDVKRFHSKDKGAPPTSKILSENNFNGKCFRCGGPHMIRVCPDRKPIVCYKCGEEGHIAPRCEQQSGN